MNKETSIVVAVKGFLKNDNGEVLLLQQSAEEGVDGANQFHPPGGILEVGESLQECLIREFAEETGLQVAVTQLIDVQEWVATIRGETIRFVGVFYECSAENYDMKLQETEVQSAEWISSDNLDSISVLEPSLGVLKRFFA